MPEGGKEDKMKTNLKAVQVSPHIWAVGAIDWNVRNFHGYQTSRGSTYNAFLVMDEKITLIDTVKGPFAEDLLARIASVIDPEKIDYVISNHSEPDHSGALPRILDAVKPEKLFASVAGAKTLKAYYGIDATVVKTGDSVSLGKGKIAFVDTKMLHWPDSMVSYYDLDKALFSQDAFGMHLAGSKLWADEYDGSILEQEARKYFANILNVQAPKVASLIESLPGLGLDIELMLPDHGPLWRGDWSWIVELYRDCALQKYRKRAFVAYSTMWGSTRILADALADGIRERGIEVAVTDLAVSDRSAVMTEVANSGIIAFGAPTMNNQMYPAMADALCYVKGLRPKNKLGFAFGSYGWSGEGAKQIAAELEAMGVEQPVAPIQAKYMPTEAELDAARQAGVTLADALLAKLAE